MMTPDMQIGLLIAGALLTALVMSLLCFVFWDMLRANGRGPMRADVFRSPKPGVSDMLQWAALVDDGIVMTKAGGLLAGYYFRGDDTASCTAAERNYITARVNAALSRLGDGWVSWTECIRVETTAYPDPSASQFPDPVSQAIDDERRRHFAAEGSHFESDYALVFMFTPPRREISKLGKLVYDDDTETGAQTVADQLINQFKRALSDIEDSITGSLRLQPMSSYTKDEDGAPVLYDELINFLNYTLTGRSDELRVPPVPMFMDAYMGGQELYTGDTPKYGSRFICCVSIEGFPDASRPNILSFLENLSIPYRWSTRFIFLGTQTALNELNRYRRKWKQKQRGFFSQVFKIQSGQVNEDALLMARQADASITDAQSALVTFGYYTSVIVMTHESRTVLEDQARNVVRELRRRGFNGRVETVNTVQAWAGSLPGHAEPNVRRPIIHTLNLADLLPLSSVWAGRLHNPSPLYPEKSPPLLQAATTGATPFRLNLHVGDVGHTLVLGPTGAGKSTLLCTLIAQFMRYPDATVAAFDSGRSMFAVCNALGGRFYDLMNEGEGFGLAPLQFLDTDADLGWAAEWIFGCYELQAGNQPNPQQKVAITRALTLMRTNKEGRSLTDFLTTVQDQHVRDALQHYTISGPLGRLLDARTDSLQDGRLQVFEIAELMQMGERNLLPVLLYLFRRIERMRRGQPMLVPLDEAWVVLGHKVFRDKLREWLKVMRKANVAIVPSTQSLSDAANSGILDVLIESCPTKIFLPNVEADKSGTATNPGPNDLYRMFGLNEMEVGIIKNAQKKRHYYFHSSEGRRLFDLALGPLALSLVAVSDPVSIARIKTLMKEHGADWPRVWALENGAPIYDLPAAQIAAE